MIDQLFPILATSDLDRALVFYRDLLGATVTYEFPGPDGRPAYVGLEIGSSHLGIGLGADTTGVARPRAMSLWLYAADCDATIERLRARVLDPDGNEVVVGQRAS